MPQKTFFRWGVDFLKNLVYHLNMSKTYTYPKIIIHGFSESLKRFMMNEYFEFDEKSESKSEYIRIITCVCRSVRELIEFELRCYQTEGYVNSAVGRIDKQYIISTYGNNGVCKCEQPICRPPYKEEIKTISRGHNKFEFALVDNPIMSELAKEWFGYIELNYSDLKIEFQVHTSSEPLYSVKKSQVIWEHDCVEEDDDYNIEKDLEDLHFELSFFKSDIMESIFLNSIDTDLEIDEYHDDPTHD